MGKRSNFKRRKNDFYETPYEAILPLLPHLEDYSTFYEPCLGNGALVRHLEANTHRCFGGSDLEIDATTASYNTPEIDYFITNPPWTRELLHPMILNLSRQLDTWLLFDAGWMFTKQAISYLTFCERIVTVGRLKWIEGSAHSSKDDCCWYKFVAKPVQKIQFFPKS